MSIQLLRNFRLMLLQMAGICILCGINSTVSLVFAQEQSTQEQFAGEENLTGIDWDAEEAASETDEGGGAYGIGDPATMDWEEDGESATFEDDNAMAERETDRRAVAEREFKLHVWGFLLFVFYLAGAVVTAYFTRNRKIAVHYPPELLIVLHTFWPLQWIFLLFAGQKVK